MLDPNQLRFQVIINGIPYGPAQQTYHLAESLIRNLTPDQQKFAEIKQITAEGKQMLFE